MDKDDKGKILDLFEYEDYEEIYKCGECDCESWRYLTNGTMVCTSCYMEYPIDSFEPGN